MKKEKYVEKKGMFDNATDYEVYHMNAKERIIGFLLFGIGSLAAVHIFFGNIAVDLICMIIGGLAGIKIYRKKLKEKRSNDLLRQFRDMLESLSTSLGSGKNTQDAFADAVVDMQNQYGEDACIVVEVKRINDGLCNNISIEAMLSDFAERSHLEDVENFSDVFRVANRMGGNIRAIVYETKNVISEKISVEFEIQTMISGKKNELTIMLLLPFIVVTQIQGMQGGTAVSGKALFITVAVKLAALAMFAGAYVLGQKIMKIKV